MWCVGAPIEPAAAGIPGIIGASDRSPSRPAGVGLRPHTTEGPGVRGMTESGTPERGVARRAAQAIEREAACLGVPSRTAWILFGLPIAVTVGVALTIPIRPLYAFLIEEDRIIEWLQVGLIGATAVLFLAIATRLIGTHLRAVALLYFAAAATFVFIGGEEISWGQRLLGWETPEVLAEVNKQGETTFHNIGEVLRVFNLAMMLGSLLAILTPIARHRRAGERSRTLVEALFIPPLFLAPAFFVAFAYRLVRFTVLPDGAYVVSRFQEVTELTFYFAVFVFARLAYQRVAAEVAEDRTVAVTTTG